MRNNSVCLVVAAAAAAAVLFESWSGYLVLQVSVWVFVIAMGGLGGLPPSRGGFGGAEPPLR